MPTKVIMPKLGESVVEGTVTAWLKKEGDHVDEYESLLEVNTDKVDTEVPSSASGTLLKILVPEGKTVEAGTTLAWIGEPGDEIPEGDQVSEKEHETQEKPEEDPERPEPETQEPAPQQPAGRDEDLGFISPVVARMAHEEKVDLSKVQGSGMDGRITKKDVQSYLESHKDEEEEEVSIWETPADGDLFRPTEMVFAKRDAEAGKTTGPAVLPGETIPLTPMRKKIAEHMVHSKRTAPHVTTVMEADMSRVAMHRETNQKEASARGVRLTYTAYLLSAIIAGLKAVPLANSSWQEEGIQIHQQINLGLAVALESGGLIVPVIKNATELSLTGIARAVTDLASRARDGELKPDEVQGGTFTLTNHGTKGSLFATPVINQPQSGILGTGLIQKRAVVIQNAIAIRPMVYLSYTFDHRILDGASADTFLWHVVQTLEDWPSP